MRNADVFELIRLFLKHFLKIESQYIATTDNYEFTFRVNLPCPTCDGTGNIKVEHVSDTGEKLKEEETSCPVCYGDKEITSYIKNRAGFDEIIRFFKSYSPGKKYYQSSEFDSPYHKSFDIIEDSSVPLGKAYFYDEISKVQENINKDQSYFSKYVEELLGTATWGKKELTKEEKLKKMGIL